VPFVDSERQDERQTKSGGALFYSHVGVKFLFCSAEDGSAIECRVVGEAMDSADKSTNKAMSAAMKYACILTFCIPTEGDNDADLHTLPEIEPKKKEPKEHSEAYKRLYAGIDFVTTENNTQTGLETWKTIHRDEVNALPPDEKKLIAEHYQTLFKKVSVK
jgi:hypothetical protein